ncbi:MAG: hypothetical protein ACE5IP_03715 [Terriglobia bacterium]
MKRPLLEQTFPANALDRLREAGFECATIGRDPERIRVLKHNCAALFERQADGQLRLAHPPGYLFRGEIARLWDAGYQKFWLLGPPAGRAGPPSDEPFSEPRRPALTAQLKELHRYTEELMLALGVPSFYNESIGTTSEVSVYDRVQDRSPARRKS